MRLGRARRRRPRSTRCSAARNGVAPSTSCATRSATAPRTVRDARRRDQADLQRRDGRAGAGAAAGRRWNASRARSPRWPLSRRRPGGPACLLCLSCLALVEAAKHRPPGAGQPRSRQTHRRCGHLPKRPGADPAGRQRSCSSSATSGSSRRYLSEGSMRERLPAATATRRKRPRPTTRSYKRRRQQPTITSPIHHLTRRHSAGDWSIGWRSTAPGRAAAGPHRKGERKKHGRAVLMAL